MLWGGLGVYKVFNHLCGWSVSKQLHECQDPKFPSSALSQDGRRHSLVRSLHVVADKSKVTPNSETPCISRYNHTNVTMVMVTRSKYRSRQVLFGHNLKHLIFCLSLSLSPSIINLLSIYYLLTIIYPSVCVYVFVHRMA